MSYKIQSSVIILINIIVNYKEYINVNDVINLYVGVVEIINKKYYNKMINGQSNHIGFVILVMINWIKLIQWYNRKILNGRKIVWLLNNGLRICKYYKNILGIKQILIKKYLNKKITSTIIFLNFLKLILKILNKI